MEPSKLRLIFSLILFVHGVGHIQGVLSSLGVFNTDTWHPRSWLFDRLLGEKVSRIVALVLWGFAVLGSLAAAFAFLDFGLPHGIWRALAVTAAVPSSLGLIFYWNSMAMLFNKLGAIAVNLWILVGILIMNWPSESDFGF